MRAPLANNAGLVCQHCAHRLHEPAAFCPQCGRGLSSADPPGDADKDVYLLVVTANVLRLRKQWGLAEAKCSEALARDPRSATAHSVMGDIMRDQGRLRDAAEWYKMALDRDPASAPDRKKLERVIDDLFVSRPAGLANRARAAVNRGLGTALADVRSQRPPGALAVLVVAVLGAIFVIAISTILVGRRAGPEVPPAEAASGAFAAAPGIVAPAVPRSPVSPAPAAADSDALADQAVARERELAEYLDAQTAAFDPNCRLLSVEIDPVEATAAIRLSMPRLLSRDALRGAVLRIIGRAGALAAAWDDRIAAVRVRCDIREPNGEQHLAIIAKGNAQRLANLPVGETAGVERAFDSVWWHPQLRE